MQPWGVPQGVEQKEAVLEEVIKYREEIGDMASVCMYVMVVRGNEGDGVGLVVRQGRPRGLAGGSGNFEMYVMVGGKKAETSKQYTIIALCCTLPFSC